MAHAGYECVTDPSEYSLGPIAVECPGGCQIEKQTTEGQYLDGSLTYVSFTRANLVLLLKMRFLRIVIGVWEQYRFVTSNSSKRDTMDCNCTPQSLGFNAYSHKRDIFCQERLPRQSKRLWDRHVWTAGNLLWGLSWSPLQWSPTGHHQVVSEQSQRDRIWQNNIKWVAHHVWYDFSNLNIPTPPQAIFFFLKSCWGSSIMWFVNNSFQRRSSFGASLVSIRTIQMAMTNASMTQKAWFRWDMFGAVLLVEFAGYSGNGTKVSIQAESGRICHWVFMVPL